MVIDALPLVLAHGAVCRQQIGLIIIGGMLFGTLFTLFFVPVIYTLLAARKSTLS
jgi:multidrug efflux pump